jgi:hypothetical protein
VDIRIDNVDPIFVGESRVSSFPSCYATTTRTESDGGLFDPCGAKTIEEVSFTGNLSVFKVGIAKLADVYLRNM